MVYTQKCQHYPSSLPVHGIGCTGSLPGGLPDNKCFSHSQSLSTSHGSGILPDLNFQDSQVFSPPGASSNTRCQGPAFPLKGGLSGHGVAPPGQEGAPLGPGFHLRSPQTPSPSPELASEG